MPMPQPFSLTFCGAHKHQNVAPLPPCPLHVARLLLVIRRVRHDPAEHAHLVVQLVGHRCILHGMRLIVHVMLAAVLLRPLGVLHLGPAVRMAVALVVVIGAGTVQQVVKGTDRVVVHAQA